MQQLNLNPAFKAQNTIRAKAYQYIIDRKEGKIQPFRTPFPKLNAALLDGIEWGSVVILAGNSGTGKTAVAEQIINEGPIINPGQNIVYLKFQLEMLDVQGGIREFTAAVDLDMKTLYSAEPGLKDSHIEKLSGFITDRKHDKVYTVDQQTSIPIIKKRILEFAEECKKVYGKDVGIVVMLDHSLLIKKAANEDNRLETLGNLGDVMIELKRSLKIIFMLLNQFNNSIDDYSRKEEGKLSNYPMKSDIYAVGQLYHAADVVIAMMRPGKDHIKKYGPLHFEVTPDHIVFHLLKSRFDDNSILFFKSNLARFQIEECDVPKNKLSK